MSLIISPARAESRGWLRGGDIAQWGALVFPKPAGRISGSISELWAGTSSCGCYENPESGSVGGQRGELQTPEGVAPGWLKALAHLPLMTFKSQNLIQREVGKEEMKKVTSPTTVPLLPAVEILLSSAFLLFSFCFFFSLR